MSEELDAFEVSYPQAEEQRGGGDKKFTPLPEGLYWVDVAQVRYKAHARGPMFGLMMKVVEDPINEKSVGRTVWGNIIFLPYYSDKEKTKTTPGAGIPRQFLKAIGEPYKGEKLAVSPKKWVGRTLGIRVKHDATGRENIKAFFNAEDYRKALETPAAATLPEEAIF